MADKRIATTPRIIRVTPRSKLLPQSVATNQSTLKSLKTTSTPTKPASEAVFTQSATQSTVARNQQGVYFQILPNAVQTSSSTSSNLVIQPQNVQKPAVSKLVLSAGSTVQKASTATATNVINTSTSVSLQQVKIRPYPEPEPTEINELPFHVIVETQFIEKEKLSENCLRTILNHETQIKNKAKSDQLLPAKLRSELRKAANNRVKRPCESSRNEAIIISDDDDSNSNEVKENVALLESGDPSKYVIQLDGSLASIFSDMSTGQLVIPSSITNHPSIVLSIQEGDDQTLTNILAPTSSQGHQEESLFNIQNIAQLTANTQQSPTISLPVISEVISQGQSQQVIPNQPQIQIPQLIQQTGSPVFIEGSTAANLPIISGIVPTAQLQTSDGQVFAKQPVLNPEFPVLSDVLSQAENSQISPVNAVLPVTCTSLPIIKEVISQAQIQDLKSPQANPQPTLVKTQIRLQQSQGKLEPFQPIKLPIKPSTNQVEKASVTQVQKSSLGDIEDSPELPITHIFKNRPFFTPKNTIDQIVQTRANIVSTASMTESLWPQRNRSIQCDISLPVPPKPATVSVAIQCTLNDPEANRNKYIEPFEEVELFNSFDRDQIKSYRGGMWECLVCGEVGANSAHIAPHYQKHGEKSSLCSYCGKSLKTRTDLKFHELTVHKGRRLKRSFRLFCPYPSCTKINRTVPDLYDHINTHTGEKPHKCSCAKSFHTYRMLQLHRIKKKCAKNKTEYPYCNLPRYKQIFVSNSRKFFKKGKVVTAIFKRKNYKKREAVCKLCLKIYKNWSQLANHVRAVHKQKFKCRICKQEICITNVKDHLKAEKFLSSQRKISNLFSS